jgi:hypothetical protein
MIEETKESDRIERLWKIIQKQGEAIETINTAMRMAVWAFGFLSVAIIALAFK